MKIDKGIPVPTAASKADDWPFDQMEIGDSFLVVLDEPANEVKLLGQIDWRKARAKLASKNTKRFTRRKVEGGYRVWRVE